MRVLFTTLILLVFAGVVQAQSLERFVVASAGNTFSNTQANVMLEFTIGEMAMVETFFANGHFLTQGFHQPEFKDVGIAETDIFQEFVIYPNPAAGEVHIRYELKKPGTLSFELFSMNGVRLFYQEGHPYYGGQEIRTLDLHEIAQGMYFVQATYTSMDGRVNLTEFKKLSVIKH